MRGRFPGHFAFLGVGLFLAFTGCRSKQALHQEEKQVLAAPDRPAWVTSRPVTDANYIGIGSCPVARADFQETAKKNALNDLASEISVTVQGNSLLYTLDRKYKFDEEFTSTIATSTKERIEGFELVDSYNDGTTYWTYYRLNKAEYARLKAQRKQQAMDQATDMYSRAKTALAMGDLKSAFDLDLRGLVAMKDHWGESDLATVDGRSFPLANELFNELQKMASGVRLAVIPERCVLDWSNRYARQLLITASFTGSSTPLAQLPITVEYPGQGGKFSESRSTDADGRARTTVERPEAGTGTLELVVRLDAEALVGKDLDPSFTKPLIGSLTVPETRVPIERVMPKFKLGGGESNLGKPMAEAPLAMAIRESLTAQGFREVDRDADADLLVEVSADTRGMGESNGFFTVALDETVKARDRKTSEVIYAGGKQGLKGIQLDYAKAGLDAYKKAAAEMRNEVAPALINSVLRH